MLIMNFVLPSAIPKLIRFILLCFQSSLASRYDGENILVSLRKSISEDLLIVSLSVFCQSSESDSDV